MSKTDWTFKLCHQSESEEKRKGAKHSKIKGGQGKRSMEGANINSFVLISLSSSKHQQPFQGHPPITFQTAPVLPLENASANRRDFGGQHTSLSLKAFPPCKLFIVHYRDRVDGYKHRAPDLCDQMSCVSLLIVSPVPCSGLVPP